MADKQQIDEWLEKGKGGYGTNELRAAFDQVKNPEHWKYDIDAVVSADLADVLKFAVPYHTGGDVDIVDLGDGKIRVVAPGYYTNGMEDGIPG